MKRITSLALIGIVFLTACSTQGWKLVWSDEFDSETINPLWVFEKGGTGWGNAELQYYTDRPENARIENGRLIIEARQEKYGGLNYTSARLNSRLLQQFEYGRVEARLKLPYGQGIWPAFWMLGSNAAWPMGGEIDIMEFIGKTPDTVYQTVHGPGYAGAKGICSHIVLTEESLKDDFHVYAIEWQPDEIRWFVDGREVFLVTPESIPVGTQWIFDHPFYIILNLAVGGGWPGYPDSTTVFPQQYQIDYVRYYQKP